MLSVRDPERWYESCRQTIFYVRNAFPAWMRLLVPRMRRVRRMLDRLAWNGMFQGRFAEKAFAIEVFNRHNEQVRRVVPHDRLLVYDVREGWEPLCAFLGVPVPDGKPFPHVNDAAEFRSRVRRAPGSCGWAATPSLSSRPSCSRGWRLDSCPEVTDDRGPAPGSLWIVRTAICESGPHTSPVARGRLSGMPQDFRDVDPRELRLPWPQRRRPLQAPASDRSIRRVVGRDALRPGSTRLPTACWLCTME